MPTAARMMAIVRARHAASDRSAGPPTGRSVVAPFSMVRCRTKRRREQRRILIGPTWARRRQSRGSQIELLPLLLHPDLGALRAFPLPLLVVDVPLELFHRDFALSTRHVYTSIAPKSASPWRGRSRSRVVFGAARAGVSLAPAPVPCEGATARRVFSSARRRVRRRRDVQV